MLPLLAVSVLAAIAVAAGSYWLGDRWAKQQLSARFEGISRKLSRAPFPLNPQVIELLSDLTNTQLLTLRRDGSVAESSFELPDGFQPGTIRPMSDPLTESMRVGDRTYLYGSFPRQRFSGGGETGVDRVVVLFDEQSLRAARIRAATLPLVTGLSTLFLLTSVALFLASRLIRRLSRLGQKVDRIAEGDFDTDIPVGVHDEIGLLAGAVERMAQQLRQMWNQISRSQGEKLLHQVAGGLAHQLRNSLTGAHLAIELHGQNCDSDDESLNMALSQVEQTESHVRRLLLVAAGKQDQDHPAPARRCLDDVRSGLDTIAKHLNVRLDWQLDDRLSDRSVSDGPSLSAAVSNLVLNAIQAGDEVIVKATIPDPETLRIEVQDNGSGPPAEVAAELFDPFVTSKPEGLGLGLPVVARSAERLGGKVEWGRESQWTSFVFTARVFDSAPTGDAAATKEDS